MIQSLPPPCQGVGVPHSLRARFSAVGVDTDDGAKALQIPAMTWDELSSSRALGAQGYVVNMEDI